MRSESASQGDANGSEVPLGERATDGASVQRELASATPSESGWGIGDGGASYQTQYPDPDWHQIAERAADEKDPRKLAFLIRALCDRLEELRQSKLAKKNEQNAA